MLHRLDDWLQTLTCYNSTVDVAVVTGWFADEVDGVTVRADDKSGRLIDAVIFKGSAAGSCVVGRDPLCPDHVVSTDNHHHHLFENTGGHRSQVIKLMTYIRRKFLHFIKYWPIFKIFSLARLPVQIQRSLKIPPHLKRVATQPCKY